jgi:hypothetical protein
MPSACGLACEVCGMKDRGLCPVGDGCVPGTDPSAPQKAESFKALMGRPCYMLECAIKNKVDHCTRCDKFPCQIHYENGIYNPKVLDVLKVMLANK